MSAQRPLGVISPPSPPESGLPFLWAPSSSVPCRALLGSCTAVNGAPEMPTHSPARALPASLHFTQLSSASAVARLPLLLCWVFFIYVSRRLPLHVTMQPFGHQCGGAESWPSPQ